MIDNMLTVSIVVPVYNVEKYLPDCIHSILDQTYKNLEIILVDDGSTDDSGKICDAYQQIDDRIKVIHQKNSGQGVARNNGIKIANGKYIGFVDSDDIIRKDMYEILLNELLNADAQISTCNRLRIAEDAKRENSFVEELPVPDYKTKMFTGNDATNELLSEHRIFKHAVWDKLYRKDLFDTVLFRNVFAEDMEVTYKLLYFCDTIVYVDQKLYGYRFRQGSTILSSWNNHKNSMLYEQDESCIDYFRSKGDRRLESAAISWHIMRCIETYAIIQSMDIYKKKMRENLKRYFFLDWMKYVDLPKKKKVGYKLFEMDQKLYFACLKMYHKLSIGE